MRRLAGLLAVFTALAPAPAQAAEPVTAPARVYALTLDAAMINPATADYIVRGIERAHKDGAAALLLRIDTPGGMLQSTRLIVKEMLRSPVPIITYVTPGGAQAGSAGVFITLAGHVAAMAPGTNIGAAHPVGGQGEDIEKSGGAHMAQKVENDTRAFAESIAAERGRNGVWAAAAVTQSVSITASEALAKRVVDIVAATDQELLAAADGRTVNLDGKRVTLAVKGLPIVEIAMTAKQRLVAFLADPNVAYLLMTLGFLGIYFELSHPGLIFPGVVGGLGLVLAFVALQVLPFNAGGLALVVLALVLFILEIFITSYGMLTLGGVISMVLGGLLLFDTPDASLHVDTGIIVAVAATMAAFAGLVSWLVAKAMRAKVTTGPEGMLGTRGHATSALAPAGTVFVHGEIWQAVSESPAAKGEEVIVIAVEGLTLRVRPAAQPSNQGGAHA